MGCRCNERRVAVVKTFQAVRSGDADGVASNLQFIAKTTVEDAGSALRKSIHQARTSLMMRKR